MTAGLADLLPTRSAPVQHLGPSDHAIARGLVNAAWGSPLRDIDGLDPITLPTVRGAHDNRDGCIGNASHNTSPHYWRALVNVTSNSPCSMFAVVWLDSTSQRGIVAGLGDSNNADTGINIGVGNTAPDALGNNLVGVRGGINYDASGQAIGVGWHTIAKTTTGSAEAWYVDGRLVSTSGTGATFNISSGIARFLMMQHGGNTGLGPSAGVHVYLGAAWNRVLPADAWAALHTDPWLMARRPFNVALLARPASGTAYEEHLTTAATATVTSTDEAARVDHVTTTAAATVTVTDARASTEHAATAATAATTATDARAGTEHAVTAAVATTALVDGLAYVEHLTTTAAATVTGTDQPVILEPVATTVTATTTGTDRRAGLEHPTSTASATTATSSLFAGVDPVLVAVAASVLVTSILAAVDHVTVAAAASTFSTDTVAAPGLVDRPYTVRLGGQARTRTTANTPTPSATLNVPRPIAELPD